MAVYFHGNFGLDRRQMANLLPCDPFQHSLNSPTVSLMSRTHPSNDFSNQACCEFPAESYRPSCLVGG